MENFFCISSYNNDLDWLKGFNNPHLIYDKTWNGGYEDNNSILKVPPSNLKERYPEFNIIKGSYYGYNVTDYLTYIIDNFNNLPEFIVFMKANTIGRHVREETFRKICNNKYFTCIEDYKLFNLNQNSIKKRKAMVSCDGGWLEKNTSWYLRHHKHPTKFFLSYNAFLSFCFKDPVLPDFIRFPPGGCYIVSKHQILKYDSIFYRNLRLFSEHSRVSGEGQLLERAFYTLWNCNFEVSSNMKKLINPDNFKLPNPKIKTFFYLLSKLKEINFLNL